MNVLIKMHIIRWRRSWWDQRQAPVISPFVVGPCFHIGKSTNRPEVSFNTVFLVFPTTQISNSLFFLDAKLYIWDVMVVVLVNDNIVSWEPEGRYCSLKMFRWKPEARVLLLYKVNALLKPKRHSAPLSCIAGSRGLMRMRTNIVYFRVMRRLYCRKWNLLWNWLCVNLHPWQRTHDHGVWRLTITAYSALLALSWQCFVWW